MNAPDLPLTFPATSSSVAQKECFPKSFLVVRLHAPLELAVVVPSRFPPS